MEQLKQQGTSKRKLKLGDIAEHLQIKKFVVRSWEKELGLAPQNGGYDADGVELFKKIKHLVTVEHQSLDQIRQVIGASKLMPTIQPATLEHKEITITTEEFESTKNEEKNCAQLMPSHESCTENFAALPEQECIVAATIEPILEEKNLKAEAAPTHQQFFSELQVFKQELMRLQELLKA